MIVLLGQADSDSATLCSTLIDHHYSLRHRGSQVCLGVPMFTCVLISQAVFARWGGYHSQTTEGPRKDVPAGGDGYFASSISCDDLLPL